MPLLQNIPKKWSQTCVPNPQAIPGFLEVLYFERWKGLCKIFIYLPHLNQLRIMTTKLQNSSNCCGFFRRNEHRQLGSSWSILCDRLGGYVVVDELLGWALVKIWKDVHQKTSQKVQCQHTRTYLQLEKSSQHLKTTDHVLFQVGRARIKAQGSF